MLDRFRKKKECGETVHFVCLECEAEGKHLRAMAVRTHVDGEDEISDEFKLVELPKPDEHGCMPSGFEILKKRFVKTLKDAVVSDPTVPMPKL